MGFKVCLAIQYPDFTLDVDLTLPTSGVTAIFGPSGSGKTSLIRAIAGLDRPHHGQITFGEQVWQAHDIFIPPHKRSIGYVFQESSLFDHLTVQKNLDYGLKRAASPLKDDARDHILDLLDLTPLLHRRPAQLSGGERQRVAIARALFPGPELLLMDEPMASLDFTRRKEILSFLERLKSDLKIPLLYISHNVDEVTRLADHLVVMANGKVTHQGPLQDILSHHKILNRMSDEPFTLLFGRVATVRTPHHLTEVHLSDAMIRMPCQNVTKGQEIRLHLYAKDVSIALSRPKETSVLNILECRIDVIDEPTEDGQCLIHLTLKDTRLQARVSTYSCAELNLQPGRQVYAQIKAVSIVQ